MSFAARAAAALKNAKMVAAVKASTERLYRGRLTRYAELGPEETAQLRRWARSAKEKAVADLDLYLEQFATQVRGRGGQVHFCRTEQDAQAAVVRIAKQAGAQTVVKSKSMATEEIHLNHALEAAGVRVVETDLGEYIIQLAGETPGHIVGPAIHKTRFDIAELFARVAGTPVDPDPAALLSFARARLRADFLAADIGITGCNFAVAETGSIVLVTNEGNANLVTSQPRIQVVVVGMEKIVPTWADLEPLLTLLTRAATGQTITGYVGMITGPRLAGELDGAEALHVVIIDNGRSAMRHTEFEPALWCIRCGSCLNVCPVYRQTGGHAYGDTYSGPIGAIITPLLRGMEDWCDLPHASSLCGACHEACPVEIPLHDLLLKLRHKAAAEQRTPVAERWVFRLWSWAWSNPSRYRWFGRLARWLAAPLARQGWLSWAPGPFGAWTQYRDLPVVQAKTFRDQWARRKRMAGDGRAD